MKQMKGEKLSDYVQRFREYYETLETLLGRDGNLDFLQRTDAWIAAGENQRTEMEFDSWERDGAYQMVFGADRIRFESLLQKWQEEFSAGSDNYPRSIATAADIMENWHRPIGRPTQYAAKSYEQKQQGSHSVDNQPSAKTRHNKDTSAKATNLAQGSASICYVCGDRNHKKPQCPKLKDTPVSEYWITRQATK